MSTEEKSNIIVRTPLWHHIYAIVRQIPRENTPYDAMDAISAATQIENLLDQNDYNKLHDAFRSGLNRGCYVASVIEGKPIEGDFPSWEDYCTLKQIKQPNG